MEVYLNLTSLVNTSMFIKQLANVRKKIDYTAGEYENHKFYECKVAKNGYRGCGLPLLFALLANIYSP